MTEILEIVALIMVIIAMGILVTTFKIIFSGMDKLLSFIFKRW